MVSWDVFLLTTWETPPKTPQPKHFETTKRSAKKRCSTIPLRAPNGTPTSPSGCNHCSPRRSLPTPRLHPTPARWSCASSTRKRACSVRRSMPRWNGCSWALSAASCWSRRCWSWCWSIIAPRRWWRRRSPRCCLCLRWRHLRGGWRARMCSRLWPRMRLCLWCLWERVLLLWLVLSELMRCDEEVCHEPCVEEDGWRMRYNAWRCDCGSSRCGTQPLEGCLTLHGRKRGWLAWLWQDTNRQVSLIQIPICWNNDEKRLTTYRKCILLDGAVYCQSPLGVIDMTSEEN